MADPFVDQLASLCREHVTRAKWVFVPSHAVGRTLGERIALGGTNWLNLRFVTPLDIALRMGAPFLVERGIEPSEEGLGPALIMRLLLDLPEDGGYFRPLADQPTMAQALYATVRELRMAGIKAEDLKAGAFESPAKYRELRALLSSYEQFLIAGQRGDIALVFEEAVHHADWCPIQQEDCWTELPDVAWSPRQRSLIAAMPGERIAPRALNIPGATIPQRIAAQGVQRIEPDPASNALAFLMRPGGEARIPNSEPRLPVASLFIAGGREAEVEEVFRRILSAGVPLDQVEVGCASDDHLSLVWEKAMRHDWPVTLGPGIPACRTRPGRALLGLCDWVETDFAAGHLRRLLESGDLNIPTEEGFTSGQAARIVARSEAGWGRNTYKSSLGGLQRMYRSRAADAGEDEEYRSDAKSKADQAARVLVWVDRLIASVPEPKAGDCVALQEVVTGVLHFIEHTTARKNALDHRAADALADFIGELQALGAFDCPLPQALRFIRERVQSLQVATDRARPGHLFACTLSQLGYSGRRHLYVVGLEEGRVFPGAAEDPILLDTERAAISPTLRLSTDRIDESVYGVLSRLAVSGAAVTFSYSCRDTREFRETYASWLMLQAFRVQQRNASCSYPDMKKALGEPVSIVPADRDAATSYGSWWLRSVVGSDGSGVTQVEAAFPSLKRGRVAEEHRESETFTEYDGYVPEAGTILDPCAKGTVLSVTELERVAACPFRFFVTRGLGVRPVEERERDKDVWLDALTRGTGLHDLYQPVVKV